MIPLFTVRANRSSSTKRDVNEWVNFLSHAQLAFNSTAIIFRIAKFRRSNLGPKFALKMGPKFALKMGPKFALTDIFQDKMGRGYLLMNLKKSEVCTLGYVPSLKFSSV